MHVKLDHIEDIASSIKTFWFKPEKPVHYTAGQFTELFLPHEGADDRGIKRYFTLSSSPSEPLLSITTKHAAENGSTFKNTLFGLRPGTELVMAEPMGDFVLPKDTTIPLVFVAGGIGVTPMRSMTKWMLDTGESRIVHLLHAANSPSELAFYDLFKQKYGGNFIPVVKEADNNWEGEVGSLTPERVKDLIGSDARTLVYLSGPEPMLEAFAAELKQSGVDDHRIVTDYFPGYTKF